MKTSPTNPSRTSWVEVSLRRLGNNLRIIRSIIPAGCTVIAVVKANAYGHGDEIITRALLENQVEHFAVATLEEALRLRNWAPSQTILVLGGCYRGEESLFRRHNLVASIYDARSEPGDLPVHVKIDTGMTRLGIPWTEAPGLLEKCPWNIRGVFSHFSSADTDPEFTSLQLKRFLEVTDPFRFPRHISNSAGLSLKGTSLEAVRIGLALYGISPGPDLGSLQPVLEWKTRIMSLKTVPAGSAVGYGGTYIARRPTLLAQVPTGYADGYNRLLSNRAMVRVRGQLAPLAGRVSMDMTCIDVTDVPGVKPDDDVVLLEADHQSPLSAGSLARITGTIPYEILTSIGSRVARVKVD